MGRTRLTLLCLAFVLFHFSAAEAQARFFAVGDVNGDGKPDVVAVSSSVANSVVVFLNAGADTLGPGTFFGLFPSTGLSAVSLADVNGDGFLDIVVTASPIQVLLGDGKGGFGSPIQVPLGALNITSPVAIADFNGDGKLDIAIGVVTAVLGPPQVEILSGDGLGNFSNSVLSTVGFNFGGGRVAGLSVADENKDGIPDLIMSVETSRFSLIGTPFVATNDGTGRFTSTQLNAAGFVTFGDFNGDGNLDFVTTQIIPSANAIAFGDGQEGVLRTTAFFSAGTFSAVDFDLNGTLDFFNGKTLFPGNGHGGFGDGIALTPAPPNGNIVAIADMDGDGHPDLLVQSPTVPDSLTIVPTSFAALPITASTRPSISFSATTSNVGEPVTLLTQVASDGGTPVGNVTFTDNATSLGTVPVNIYGFASVNTTFTAGGTSTASSAFAGALDASTGTSFSNSTAASTTATALSSAPLFAAPSVSFTMSPNPAFALSTVTLTPTVTSPSGTPAGFVVFRADGDVIGVTAVGSSTTSAFPTAGLHNIQASYGGDGSFPPATSATLVEDVRALNATRAPSSAQLAITPSPTDSTLFSLSGSLAGIGNPQGNFIYRVDGSFLDSQPAGKTVNFTAPSQGTYTVSVEYAGDPTLLPSSTSTKLTVGNPAGDFSLHSASQVATVTAGQSAAFGITVVPSGGFSLATTFSCSGLPAGASCTFSPATVTTANDTPANVAVTVTTTAAASTVPAADPDSTGPVSPVFVLMMGFALLVFLASAKGRRERLATAATALGLILFVASCGGSGSAPGPTPTPTPAPSATPTPTPSPSPTPTPVPSGTPAGTYLITVTATSAAATHPISLSLTVQ